MCNKKFIHGFTLIELLIAVSIFMAVIISVYSAFNAGVFAWRRLNAACDVYQQTGISLQLMADEIASYIPSDKIKMEGTGSEISFLESFSVASKANLVLAKFSFDSSANVIMKSREDFKSALNRVLSKTEPDEKNIISEEFLPFVKEMKLSYLCKDTAGTGGYKWVDSLSAGSNKDCEAVRIFVSVLARKNIRGYEMDAVNFTKTALILQKEN